MCLYYYMVINSKSVSQILDRSDIRNVVKCQLLSLTQRNKQVKPKNLLKSDQNLPVIYHHYLYFLYLSKDGYVRYILLFSQNF